MNKNHEFCIETNEDKIIATALKCLEERMGYKADKKFISSSTVKDYLRLQLSPEKNEIFAALFLDNHYRLLAFERLFNGTINEAVVYPRVLVQKAVEHNAARIIVSHNHPSGIADASEADKKLTQDLKKILEIINVKLVDHIVVTPKETFSFAENDLM
jgi:DNA repair protein RadC